MGIRRSLRDKLKVFVSSTYEDLKEERAKITEGISALELEPSAMELFGSRPGEPLEECLTEVRDCNIFVLIIGERYGAIPEGRAKSYTEFEYLEAKKRDKLIMLAYVKEIKEPYENTAFADFVASVKADQTISKFSSVEEIVARVRKDIMREVSRLVHDYMSFEPDFERGTPQRLIDTKFEPLSVIPANKSDLISKAVEYYDTYQYNRASYLVTEGLKKFKKDYRILWLHSALVIDMRDLGYKIEDKDVLRAIGFFERAALSRKEDSSQALYNAGNGYGALELHAKAIVCYEKAISLGLNSPEVWKNLASSYDNLGEVSKALESVNKSLELKPDLVEGLISKGLILGYRLGEPGEGIELYKKAKRLRPNIEEVMPHYSYNLAWLYFLNDDFVEALDLLENYENNPIRVRDPQRLKMQILNSLWRENRDYLSQSFEVIEDYIQNATEPVYPYWYLELGLIAHRLDDKTNEEKYLKMAIDSEYEDALLFDRYAHILDKKEKTEIALVFYKKAYALDNYFSHCFGKALLKAGNTKESLRYLEEAIRVGPEDAIVWHDLGVCRSRLRMTYLAAFAFEKAIEYDNGYVLAYCNLIGAYLKSGLREQAKKWASRLNTLEINAEEIELVRNQFGGAPEPIKEFLGFTKYFN